MLILPHGIDKTRFHLNILKETHNQHSTHYNNC